MCLNTEIKSKLENLVNFKTTSRINQTPKTFQKCYEEPNGLYMTVNTSPYFFSMYIFVCYFSMVQSLK